MLIQFEKVVKLSISTSLRIAIEDHFEWGGHSEMQIVDLEEHPDIYREHMAEIANIRKQYGNLTIRRT